MKKRIVSFLDEPVIVINLGLKQFSENLDDQSVQVVQVDWTPPAGGDKEVIELLDELL
jgi:hypothetical protein